MIFKQIIPCKYSSILQLFQNKYLIKKFRLIISFNSLFFKKLGIKLATTINIIAHIH